MEKAPAKYILNDSLGYLSARVSKTLLKRIGAALSAAHLPITQEEFTFLIHLWDSNGQSQKSLAQSMLRDKTSIAKLAARIESKGLITREAGPSDAREKRVFLTGTGKSVMEEVTRLVQGILIEAQEGIPEDEVRICRKVLGDVFQNLLSEKNFLDE